MDFIKPTKGKFVFNKISQDVYNTYAKQYQSAKKIGVRGITAWATGAGVVDIVKEVAAGTIRTWGRRKIGAVILGSAGYVCSPVVTLVTNSTTIINSTKRVHSSIAYAIECFDDFGGLMYLPLDQILFGQPIPMGEVGRFNFYTEFQDFLSS